MSETPERKVLKEMLTKLKAKVIDSQNTVHLLSTGFSESMTKELSDSFQKAMKMPDNEAKMLFLLILTFFQTWKQNFDLMRSNVNALIGDMALYIDTLEQYSTELDSTLTDIFKQAEKRAEEQQEKREEMQKKKPDYIE